MSDTDRRAVVIARRRVEEALPSSPEWAAAIEALEEIVATLRITPKRGAAPNTAPTRTS